MAAPQRSLLLIAPLAIFLLLACVALDRPGLHYDEALEAGLPALELLLGRPVTVPNGVALRLWGRELPLMVQNHIGATQVYAALPFVLIGGPEAISLRLMTVVVGALTIVAVSLFLVQVYGRMAAFYGGLWLATFSSFVFWSRQGVFVTSLAICFATWALAAGAYWWRTGRSWAAGAAGLCFGLAIYSKLSALWLLNGLVGWWLISTLAAWLRARHGDLPASPLPDRRALIIGVAGLLAGIWPFLLYNLRSGAATLDVIERSATRTYLGTSNLDIPGNLLIRLAQAADVVRSGSHLWYLGGSFPNDLALAWVLAALLFLIVDCARRRWQDWRRQLLGPFLALAVILQSCYTISALWPTHFAVAAPLPAIIVGAAAGRIFDAPIGASPFVTRLARQAAMLLLALALASQILTSLSYLRSVISTGGLSFHSSAIYELTDYLKQRGKPVLALDWGIAAQVEYLSGGAVQVEEHYRYEQQPSGPDAELIASLNSDRLYVTHAPGQEAFPHRAVFLSAAAAANLRAEPIRVLRGADGLPLIEVWQLRELP